MARSLTLIFILITLLDSGTFNLIQRVKSDDDSAPPGTFLPGKKLGVNHRTGYIWSLSSSPSPLGSFTLSWEHKRRQLHISLGEVVYWSSGVFKDGRFEYISSSRYNFTIVSNKREDSITYSTVDHTDKVSAWLLTDTGDLYDTYTGDDIARADCDGYSTEKGCRRRLRPSSCMATFGVEFQLRKAYCHSTSERTPYYFRNVSNGASECKAACWQDCECLGFDIAINQTAGCRFWSADCQFDKVSGFSSGSSFGSGSSFVLSRLIPSQPSSPGSIKQDPARRLIWIGTAVVSALLVMVSLFACYLLIRRIGRKLVHSDRNGAKVQEILTLMKPNIPTHENDGKIGNDISVFSYTSVLAATRNFSNENKLGEGGFGSVYQGKLVTGQEIAVKKLSKNSEQGALEFKNELILVYELQHTNLVRLFGFCIRGEERMLIYEYMPNKSLDNFLFDSTRGVLLNWKRRFNIIEGVAQGLLYLHKYSRMRVIHRDLKASNILLDESMNPRISDFGMARTFTQNELEANTKRIVGTYGYMSPEYVFGGNFSIKSDVYSFGVLMLEIISGRRNNSFYNDDRVLTLAGYTWELWKKDAALELMDPTLGNSCDEDQLLRCMHVGLLCVEENATDRPNMSDLISMLTNESVPLPKPTKPAFCTRRNVITSGIDRKGPELESINGLSISDFAAR
ncbi:G-type lectin S-receptor-like serine/threonine-protein kinase CES101 isoform X1 [Rosa chinensis]|uniref:G-type lectin S-receptor-like serine/threonine-protein kinase CES101 isoform X1 n=1 Tax=Rosa chinensis TaxID=74649 RepID=UPI000D08DF66|nr:G-type lectin S-receptor-like serine/threonine-protein kinase CES101 isoform X1 [Rosa chinensis]